MNLRINKNIQLLRESIKLLLLVFLCSCVGTIEDTEVQKSKTIPTDPPPIAFDGISDVVPISHDKVEVYFFPAPGDAEKIIYEINYDGLTVPISVPGINLRPDYRGYLVHTVTGLNTNATYNFEVQAKHADTGARSIAEATLSATTFGNITCNFLGIQNVQVMPGLAGINSVKVEWAQAEKQGSIFVPKDIDPDQYVVTLVDADILTPGDLDDDAFGEPLRKRVFVSPEERSAVIGGLTAEKEYHVQVNCVHFGYTKFGSDITYKKEENHKYMSVETLSDNITNLDFESDGLSLVLSPGEAGLTSVQVAWLEAVGAFDHYRMYYAIDGENLLGHDPEAICDGAETTTNANVYCKQVTFDKTNSLILDLEPNTDYDVMVAVCQALDCNAAARRVTLPKTIKTTPQIATFSGIISIEPAKDFAGISNLYLNVSTPDLSTGIMDGVIVQYNDPILGPVPLNNPDIPAIPPSVPLRVEDYNFETDDEYVVTNVDPFSVDPYCFEAYPYVIQGGIVVPDDSGSVERCIVPKIDPPDDQQFPGAINCSTSGTNFTVEWLPPTQGVFSHYEVYLRDNAGIFEYSIAVGGSGDYSRLIVPDTQLTATFEGVPPGTYRAGVLTYVSLYGNIKRSTYNSGVIECTVP